MRILFVTRKYPPSTGGMEVFSAELYAALQRRIGDQASLCAPKSPIHGRPSLLQLAQFVWHAISTIAKSAKDNDAIVFGDCLLTPLSIWAKVLTRGKIKTIGTAHGNDVFFAKRRSVSGKVYSLLVRLSARSPDFLIANSAATASAARDLGFLRIEKVPLATTPKTVESCAHPDPAILFAGRLIEYKGLSWFIENVLPKLDQRIRLLVAGPIWDQGEMDAVKRSDRTEYLGVLGRDELSDVRRKCLACIMPNLPPETSLQDEGFGLSALESPAVGTPVVVTRCGGLPEAVVEGVTGFIIEPLDGTAFAERIHKIYAWPESQRRNFANAARSEIARYFNWDRVADDYLSLVRETTEMRDAPKA